LIVVCCGKNGINKRKMLVRRVNANGRPRKMLGRVTWIAQKKNAVQKNKTSRRGQKQTWWTMQAQPETPQMKKAKREMQKRKKRKKKKRVRQKSGGQKQRKNGKVSGTKKIP